jgi:hypothetical protein
MPNPPIIVPAAAPEAGGDRPGCHHRRVHGLDSPERRREGRHRDQHGSDPHPPARDRPVIDQQKRPGQQHQTGQDARHTETLQQQVGQIGAELTRQILDRQARSRIERRIARMIRGQRHQHGQAREHRKQRRDFGEMPGKPGLEGGREEAALIGGRGHRHQAPVVQNG